jgi:hypothetical protein
MPEQAMTERIKELGVYAGATHPVAVIRDVFAVAATLVRTDEYCWCQALPCACAGRLIADLAECLEVRYPDLAAARAAAEDENPREDDA